MKNVIAQTMLDHNLRLWKIPYTWMDQMGDTKDMLRAVGDAFKLRHSCLWVIELARNVEPKSAHFPSRLLFLEQM